MKSYHRVLLTLIILCSWGYWISTANGQAGGAIPAPPPAPAPALAAGAAAGTVGAGGVPTIPATLKTAPTPPDPAIVGSFLDYQAERLKNNDDPAAQSLARDNMVQAATTGNPQQPASPFYLDVYTTSLNEHLKAILNDAQVSMRVRLNVGIIATRVAERADNDRLQDTVMLLLNDKNEAVILWGVKAARFVIPATLRNPLVPPKVLNTLIPIVRAHPSGPIISDTYEALNLLNPAKGSAPPTPAMLNAVIPPMLQLISVRVTQYQAGMPDEPGVDRIGISFLSDPKIWAGSTVPNNLKGQILQQLTNLVGVLGQRAAAVTNPELTKLLGQLGAAFQVISDPMYVNNAGVKSAAVALYSGANTNPNGATLQQLAQGVVVAMQKVTQYGAINPPPVIAPGAAANVPAHAVATTAPAPTTAAMSK